MARLTLQDWESLGETVDTSTDTPSTGFMDDVGRSVGIGLNELYEVGGLLTEKVGLEDLGQTMQDQARTRIDQLNRELTPGFQESRSKEFIHKNDRGEYEFGTAWTDPNAYANLIASSLPAMGTGMGAGGLVTKGLSTVIKNRAVAAALGYGAGEGGVAGGLSGKDVVQAIRETPYADLAKMESFQQAYHSIEDPNLSHSDKLDLAREKIESSALLETMGKVGVATGILSAPSGIIFDRMIRGLGLGKPKAPAKIDILKHAGAEGMQEVPQEGSDVYLSESAKQKYVDPTIDPWEQVPNAMVGGGMAGLIMGGGTGAGAHVSGRSKYNQTTARMAQLRGEVVAETGISPEADPGTVKEYYALSKMATEQWGLQADIDEQQLVEYLKGQLTPEPTGDAVEDMTNSIKAETEAISQVIEINRANLPAVQDDVPYAHAEQVNELPSGTMSITLDEGGATPQQLPHQPIQQLEANGGAPQLPGGGIRVNENGTAITPEQRESLSQPVVDLTSTDQKETASESDARYEKQIRNLSNILAVNPDNKPVQQRLAKLLDERESNDLRKMQESGLQERAEMPEVRPQEPVALGTDALKTWKSKDIDSDVRLKQRDYRDNLVPFVEHSSFTKVEGDIGAVVGADEYGRGGYRAPSPNAAWVQEASRLVGSIPKLRHAVKKAVSGGNLKKNQREAVKMALDAYSEARVDAQIDSRKNLLWLLRDKLVDNGYFEGRPFPPLDELEREFVKPESGYPEDWDSETRSIDQFADEAEQYVGADAVYDILENTQLSDGEIVRQLIQIIEEGANGRESTRSGAVAPGAEGAEAAEGTTEPESAEESKPDQEVETVENAEVQQELGEVSAQPEETDKETEAVEPEGFEEWLDSLRFFRSGKHKNVELPDGEKVILTQHATKTNFKQISRKFLLDLYQRGSGRNAWEKPAEPLTEETEAGTQTKMFATPSTFGKKPVPKNAENVDSLDFTLEEEEPGLFDAQEDKKENITKEQAKDKYTPTHTDIASGQEISETDNRQGSTAVFIFPDGSYQSRADDEVKPLNAKPEQKTVKAEPFNPDSIPADMETTVKAMTPSGVEAEVQINAREAYQSLLELREKLQKTMECIQR